MSEQRRVLVTGASKGIGRAIAVRLAADGFAVTVHYGRDQQGADQTLRQIRDAGGTGSVVQFDVNDREAVKQVLGALVEEHGAYYGIVSNAGVARDKAFPALKGEDWDTVVHTNLDGFFNVVHPLTMPMVRARKGGRIVAISSVSGLIGNRGQVNYSASKAGLIGACKALAVELASRNITVNCVAPGMVETDMIANAPVEEALKFVPAGRVGQPEEVAGLVAYLLSDVAGYVTRQAIAINGGLC